MPFIEPSALARMGPQPDAPAPLPPPDAEPIGVTLQEESALAELTSFCERIRSGDDFDVLGIAEEASDEEVGVAYQALVDSLLPDLGLGAEPRLKELADEARKRLDRASDRLGKASSRNVYAALRHPAAKARRGGPAGKAPEIEELAARGLDAETWFRKGEGFLKARKFDAAVEAFGMAAHLDPKEGEYVARLGYALFLSNPKAPVVVREALEHISKGIKLSPKREKPYVYLGKIFRESGAPDRARKMLEYAVRIKPDCPSALHELKLLDELEGKDSGVLNRLRGLFN